MWHVAGVSLPHTTYTACILQLFECLSKILQQMKFTLRVRPKSMQHTHTYIYMSTQPLLAHSTADGLRTCCFYYCIYCTYCAVAVVVVGCAPKNFH